MTGALAPDSGETSPKRSLGRGLTVLAILVIGLAAIYVLLYLLGAYLIVADPLQKSEAVVVLSGGDSSRLKEGARVLREVKGDFFILTETGHAHPELGTPFSLFQELEAVELGVPPTGLLITQTQVSSTRDEALAVKKLAEKNNIISIVVVTEPYHSRRARLIFNDVFAGSNVRIAIQPVRGHWYRSASWWLYSAGWTATYSEYIKYISYAAGLRID